MTELDDDRETGLKVGYEATEWNTPISFDDYKVALKDWIIKAIIRDGLPIGAFYKKNDEIHFSIKREWRKKWLTKSLKRKVFDVKRVTTRITPGREEIIPVLNRLGFKDNGTGLWIKE